MQLAEIRTDFDPIRMLLTGYLAREDLARICSTIRNAPAGVVRNDLLDEGLMGNLGRAAMLKSKAATLIPSDLKKNEAIAKLIDAAKKSEETVADEGMAKWWQAAGKAIGAHYKVDGAALVAAVLPKIKSESDKLNAELRAGQADTDDSRGKADELSKMKKELKHKAAVKALKAKYGVEDEPDPERAAAAELKKKARAKTLAKLLGIEGGDDLDPDTLESLFGGGGGGGGGDDVGGGGGGSDPFKKMAKLLKARAALSKKQAAAAKGVPAEDAQNLLIGLARMLMTETPLSESPKWDAVKRAIGGMSMPFRYAGASAPLKGASTARDDRKSGGEGYKKAGAGFFSGLTSLFSRQGRDQMGGNAVTGAIKSYLTAQAIASMAQAAQSMSAKAGLGGEKGDAPELETAPEGPTAVPGTEEKPGTADPKKKLASATSPGPEAYIG